MTEADPIPAEKQAELGEVIALIFGEDSVIQESRDLSTLGRVLASEEGLAVLRETRDLVQADNASGGPLERLVNHLTMAVNNLRAAKSDINQYGNDDRVRHLLDDCESELNDIQERIPD